MILRKLVIRRYLIFYYKVNDFTIPVRAGIAQSVQLLAMDWKVRGSNPSGGRDFPHPSRPALRPTQPPIQWVPGLFRG